MGTIPAAEWSPAGDQIAFVGGEGSESDLYVVGADGTGLTQLTRLGTVTGADWSPDGTRLALRAAGSVFVLDVDGSNLVRLTEDVGTLVVRHVEWSPQGDRIAFSLSPNPVVSELEDPESISVHVIGADGEGLVTVATNALDPRWLPDGGGISFRRGLSDEIWVVSAEGGAPSRRLSDAFEAEWSPDGTRIAYVRQAR